MIIDFIVQYGPILLKGFFNTVYICAAGILLGLLIGAIACAAKLSKISLFKHLANIYIEFFRGTPYLIQVFLLYYVAPVYGIDLPIVALGIISLGLYSGSYFSESYRSGILSIPKGQIEASRALGIGEFTLFRRIVLPQMLVLIIAPLTNQIITVIKDSSILAVVTLEELMFSGQRIIGETFRYVEVYMIVAILYWALNTGVSILSNVLERHSTYYMKSSKQR
jgi:polar amino acid transport system permease protein